MIYELILFSIGIGLWAVALLRQSMPLVIASNLFCALALYLQHRRFKKNGY